MDENPMENPWKFDAMVNNPQNLVPVQFELWRPAGFHVRIDDTDLTDEEARQLEADLRTLIEAELNADAAEGEVVDNSISVSVAGLGLSPDRTAKLSRAIAARVREQLAKSSHQDGNPMLHEEV
jgi:hypothetical protein